MHVSGQIRVGITCVASVMEPMVVGGLRLLRNRWRFGAIIVSIDGLGQTVDSNVAVGGDGHA